MATTIGHEGRVRGDLLVVDDTPANLRLLAQVLQEAGYRVRAVTTAARALAAARRAPPDLVLLDLRLPDADGVAVCAALKGDQQTAHVPVIFISAFDDLAAKVNAFAAGGVDYVVKPINAEEVLARVATHLALRDLHVQLQTVNSSMELQLEQLARANADLQRQIALREAAELENARLLEHERRRARRLDALRDAMTAIAGALDLASVHAAVLAQAAALLDAPWSALARLMPSGDSLSIVARHGHLAALNEDALLGASGFGHAATDGGRTVGQGGDRQCAWPQSAVLTASLTAGDRLEGIIFVANDPAGSPFGVEDEQLLHLFAQQAASAVQNARLFEEVRHLARTDPLTGLYNRRYFFELARRELERTRRAQGSLAVVMLDLDHFKQVNDCFGHQAGDQTLQAVAGLLHENLRTTDVSARFGGEELVVLLPDTEGAGAAAVAERLRRAVARLVLATDGGPLSLTASFGVAAATGDELAIGLEPLIARADEACYGAKGRGRDQVVVWQPVSRTHQHDQG